MRARERTKARTLTCGADSHSPTCHLPGSPSAYRGIFPMPHDMPTAGSIRGGENSPRPEKRVGREKEGERGRERTKHRRLARLTIFPFADLSSPSSLDDIRLVRTSSGAWGARIPFFFLRLRLRLGLSDVTMSNSEN